MERSPYIFLRVKFKHSLNNKKNENSMGIDINGRVARTITSEAGLKTYYEHLNHWRVCYGNTNPLVVPTQAEALEYLKL